MMVGAVCMVMWMVWGAEMMMVVTSDPTVVAVRRSVLSD